MIDRVTDGTTADYPPSRVPLRPVLSFRGHRGPKGTLPSVLDSGESMLMTSGRAALAAALVDIGIGAGHAVLVPAFNCAAMIEPVSWCGAEVVLFKVHPDLSPDMDDIAVKAGPNARALIVVHYFGFPQDLRALRLFCDKRGIKLIEDCAHAYFGDFDGRPPGSVGDYAIASAMKFFPVYDGGCLVSPRRKFKGTPVAGDWKFQVKAVLNLLEDAVRYGRLRPLNRLLGPIFRSKDWVWTFAKKSLPAEQVRPLGPEAAEGGYGFDGKWVNVSTSWISKRVMGVTSVAGLIARRQQNYRTLAAAFKDVPGCRVLYPNLSDTVVPYAFPLLVESPGKVFPALKKAGVPLYRWEAIALDACATSAQYATSLFQIPCHQELRDDELQWIVVTIRAALRRSLEPAAQGPAATVQRL